MHVGLLEDEAHWAEHVQQALADIGWHVSWFEQGEALVAAVADRGFDAIIVDVELRGQMLRGTDIVHRLRARGCGTPVLVLTQFAAIHQAATSLDGGADDYLAKPFAADELRARLRAITRRMAAFDRSDVVCGPLRLSTHFRTAHWFDRRIELTAQGYEILRMLAESPGETVSHAALWARAWSKYDSLPPQMEAIQAGVSRLRREVAAVTAARLIRTVQGAGYRLQID